MFRGATMVNLDSKGAASPYLPDIGNCSTRNRKAKWSVPLTSISPACCFILARMEIIEQKLSRLSSMNPPSAAFSACCWGMPVSVRWIVPVVCCLPIRCGNTPGSQKK